MGLEGDVVSEMATFVWVHLHWESPSAELEGTAL